MNLRTLLLPLILAATFLLAACGEEAPPLPTFSAAELTALTEASRAYGGRPAADLQSDAGAMETGRQLFTAYCAACHSLDGRGKRDVPDLVTGTFDYGDSPAAILATITGGRHSEMPALGSTLGEVELGAMVAWLRADRGNQELGLFGGTAAELFAQHCVSCHGDDARGTPALGAPDLTDAYWQHGGEMMNVRLTITRGAQSSCPAQGPVLEPPAIGLLAAYVLQLRTPAGAAASQAPEAGSR